jgi:hypothetical protein
MPKKNVGKIGPTKIFVSPDGKTAAEYIDPRLPTDKNQLERYGRLAESVGFPKQ